MISQMKTRRSQFRWLASVALFALALSVRPASADQNDRTHQIGSKLRCMCSGCEQSAGRCYHVGGAYSGPCGTAKAMLKEIDGHIAQGKTDDQIMQAMIAEYGQRAYVEPPKTGFGLVAWLMPILYLLGGTGMVIVVMKRWRKRPAVVAATPGAGAGIRVSPEQLARARELAQRETED